MTQSTDKNLVLFANQYPISLNNELMQIAADLELKVIPADIDSFSIRERYCELYPNQKQQFIENKAQIEGAHVHIVMNIQDDPNIAFVDALNAVETVKEHGATSVHLIVTPVYARQDRHFDGRMCSVMNKTYVKHLKYAGVDYISPIDVHSNDGKAMYIDYFGKNNVHFISAAQELSNTIQQRKLNAKYTAPDGYDKPDDAAQERVKEINQIIHGENYMDSNLKLGIIKEHQGASVTRVKQFIGNAEGFDVALVDDVIDTGTTIINAADVMKQNGAISTTIASVHAGFSGNSLGNLTSSTLKVSEIEKSNPIDHIFVTDTILSVHDKYDALSEQQKEMVTIISCAPIIKRALSLKFR